MKPITVPINEFKNENTILKKRHFVAIVTNTKEKICKFISLEINILTDEILYIVEMKGKETKNFPKFTEALDYFNTL